MPPKRVVVGENTTQRMDIDNNTGGRNVRRGDGMHHVVGGFVRNIHLKKNFWTAFALDLNTTLDPELKP